MAVAGHDDQPYIYYTGFTGGGVYKTTDGGATWYNVSDGFFKTGSVGAIDVADSDPNVIYVGMGETDIRGNMSAGDGMYRSTDAGKTWTWLGLGETRFIGDIEIHPENPDVAWVAAMGKLFGAVESDERGVYKTTDGVKRGIRYCSEMQKPERLILLLTRITLEYYLQPCGRPIEAHGR